MNIIMVLRMHEEIIHFPPVSVTGNAAKSSIQLVDTTR